MQGRGMRFGRSTKGEGTARHNGEHMQALEGSAAKAPYLQR